MEAIKNDIRNSRIWLAADETIDGCNRNVVNVLVGALLAKIIEALEPNSAAVTAIKELKGQLSLKESIAFLLANYTFLEKKLETMQKRGMSIHETLRILDEIENEINQVAGLVGKKVQEKFTKVFKSNPDLEKIRMIRKVLSGEQGVGLQLSPELIAALKYTPLTTVDVERSFSLHKLLMTDQRKSFTPENLEKHIMCCFEFRSVSAFKFLNQIFKCTLHKYCKLNFLIKLYLVIFWDFLMP